MPDQTDLEFPIFLTEKEMVEVINLGLSVDLWHKFNEAICIIREGYSCCEGD